jgi:hypothetical protein
VGAGSGDDPVAAGGSPAGAVVKGSTVATIMKQSAGGILLAV